MKNESMNKVIELYKKSKKVSVVTDKNDIVDIYETDWVAIWIKNNMLYFGFDEDDIEDFKVNLDDIQDITFEYVGKTVISILKIINNDSISIHNL